MYMAVALTQISVLSCCMLLAPLNVSRVSEFEYTPILLLVLIRPNSTPKFEEQSQRSDRSM